MAASLAVLLALAALVAVAQEMLARLAEMEQSIRVAVGAVPAQAMVTEELEVLALSFFLYRLPIILIPPPDRPR